MKTNRSLIQRTHITDRAKSQLKFESLEERQLLAADISFDTDPTQSVGRQPFDIAAADLDNDGDIDLVTANHCSNEPGRCEPTAGPATFSVSVLLNQGDGTFSPETRYDTGKLPRAVTVADLDGDGIKDLAVTASGINSISVLKGNGDGSFQEQDDFDAGSIPRSIAAGDFNKDGTTDLVVTNMISDNRASGSVSFLFNQNGESFSAPFSVPTDRETLAVTAGDLDNDGDLDVVTGNATSSVSVLINNGDGTFEETVRYPTGTRMTQGVDITDVNADGHLDVVASGSQVAVLLSVGDGNGTLAEASRFGTRNSSDLFAYVSMDTGDIDGDGDTDIAAIDFNRGRMIVLANDGEGGFDEETRLSVGRWHWGMVLADFDIDGDLDVAAANNGNSNVSAFSNTTEREQQRVVGDSNGDGVFNSTDLILVFQAGEYEDSIDNNSTFEEGDWNGDGEFDSGDLVYAFQAGTYENAATPLAGAVDRIFLIDRDKLAAARPALLAMSERELF